MPTIVTTGKCEDADRFFEMIDDPATSEAMANDGVIRETVKFYVMDQIAEV